MQDALLITDSGCDLSREALEEAGIELLCLPFSLDGDERPDEVEQDLSPDAFYDALRAGARSTTSQVRSPDCEAAFRRAHDAGKAAILVTISSGLSASHDTALMARERFLQEFPDARIHVVDSLSVSAGQGLLVMEMARKLADGASADAVVVWAEDNRQRVNAVFTVDSYEYLVRGGRVSPAAAAAGSVLSIKPVLHVDAEGRLAPLKKVRGRRHALWALTAATAELITNPQEQTIIVNHAQCPEEADALVHMLQERVVVRAVRVGRIGVIIGTHVGPGGLVLAFWGKPRTSYA
ncbi:MAG: DegV family protein [Coriobacteriia bacterium]